MNIDMSSCEVKRCFWTMQKNVREESSNLRQWIESFCLFFTVQRCGSVFRIRIRINEENRLKNLLFSFQQHTHICYDDNVRQGQPQCCQPAHHHRRLNRTATNIANLRHRGRSGQSRSWWWWTTAEAASPQRPGLWAATAGGQLYWQWACGLPSATRRQED